MLHRSRRAGSLLALAGLGCAGNVPVETVVDPAYSFATVAAVAVLPLFDWSLSIRDAHSLTAGVAGAAHTRAPRVRVVSADDASRLIAAAGLAYEWALFLHDWREGGELDRTVVMRVADELGVDLLLVVDLPEVARHDGATYPYTMVVARLRAFGGTDGVLAWSGTAGLELVDQRYSVDRAPPVTQVAELALHAVLHELPQFGTGR